MKFVSIILLCMFCANTHAQSHFISSHNQSIVDSTGKKIRLEGVNLGGWLLWEGWIWGGGFTKEQDIKARLVSLFGQEKANEFIRQYYTNYITAKDIHAIAKIGFNCVRLPFNYRIFDTTGKMYAPGFAILDSVIHWCKQSNIYVVLDMHAAPGGQNNMFISDPEKEKLWQNETQIARCIQLWKDISEKYAQETTIAAYDLLNEPVFPKTASLVSLYQRLIREIRMVDPHHLIMLEGNDYAHNFSGFTAPTDSNTIFSFHYYPWFAENSKEKNLQKTITPVRNTTALWCGEWGEDNTENLAAIQNLLATLPDNCGNAFWTWKRIYQQNNRHPLCEVTQPADWKKLTGWLTWPIVKPNKGDAEKTMVDFLNAIQFENCFINENVKKAITASPSALH